MQDVRPNLDDVVGPDTQEESVKSGMVESAQGKSIPNLRLAARIYVRNDMGCVQQLFVAKPAEGALPAIGLQDPLSKSPPVQPKTHRCCDVYSPGRLCLFMKRTLAGGVPQPRVTDVIDGNCESQAGGIIGDYKCGPRRDIFPRCYAVQVDQRKAAHHAAAQASIVGMIRIRASIPVSKQTIRSECVIVGSFGSGRNRERHLIQHPWLEDPLWPDKRHARAAKNETPGKQAPGQHIAM